MILPPQAQAQPIDRAVRLGIICGTRCEGSAVAALTERLMQLGWVEGRNLTIDRRGAGGEQERLPALAAELVALKPDLIISVSPQPTRAAANAAAVLGSAGHQAW